MLLIGLAAATSTTVTSSLKPLTTYRRACALSSVTFQARLPTSTRSVTLRAATSTKATWLARPSATKARLPSRDIWMPTGVMSSLRTPLTSNFRLPITLWLLVAMMLTLASSSQVTHSSLPSGVMAMRRGRLPTFTFLTTLALTTSITCTRLAASEAT